MQQHRNDILQRDGAILRVLGDQLAKLASHSTALEKSERILQSLYCDEVYMREHGVSDAEDRTFSWAFSPWCLGHRFTCGCSCSHRKSVRPNARCWPHDKVLEPPCAGLESCQKHLLNWLECDTNEPFMITGKPGSGKSTFMKFITSHEQTRSALNTWSAKRKLVVASFYFWSPGTPLQRSQDGLLRCLLYKILSQTPEMIPVAVPQKWQVANQPRIAQPWSRKEISDAFTNVVSADILGTNFCFFIDGLDEYGGSDLGSDETDLDLVLQLRTLSSSPCVKVCLSSRPRNLFQGRFPTSGPHHITLHHHTTKDIEQLVESRIDRVQGLIKIETADLKDLKDMIVERSSGVFLWVVLVVKELLDGMEPPFSMPELKGRLLMLPSTLDGYFQRILNSVHPQYRRFNAQLLLMSLNHNQLPLCYAHSLWLLEHGEPDLDFHHAAVATDRQQPRHDDNPWCTDMASRIKKICSDFLTVSGSVSPCVGYNHRSIADFLKLPAVRKELFALAGWHAESDMYHVLCQLFVSCCQARLIKLKDNWEFERFAKNLLKHEHHSGTTCADLVYKLDRILCLRPLTLKELGVRHWTDLFMRRCHPHWAICESPALLLYTTMCGLTLFVEQAINSRSAEARVVVLNDLLRALLLGCYHPYGSSKGIPQVVEFLCSKGANVNSVARTNFTPPTVDACVDVQEVSYYRGGYHKDYAHLMLDAGSFTIDLADSTIWELYLQERDFNRIHRLRVEPVHVELAVKLIEAGADLKCRLPKGCANIQQAIEKRLELEKSKLWKPLDETKIELIRSALSRRGYVL
jgi:hypothetical protein